jgi:hypothetical protein
MRARQLSRAAEFGSGDPGGQFQLRRSCLVANTPQRFHYVTVHGWCRQCKHTTTLAYCRRSVLRREILSKSSAAHLYTLHLYYPFFVTSISSLLRVVILLLAVLLALVFTLLLQELDQ